MRSRFAMLLLLVLGAAVAAPAHAHAGEGTSTTTKRALCRVCHVKEGATEEETVKAVANAPVAANNLAYIYAKQGVNLDTALQLAQAAKQRMPNDPSVDDTIGWEYYKKDLPALAVRPLEDAARRRPDSAEVLYHLGMTYAKLGEKAKARETLERALKLDPNIGGDETRRALASVAQ